MAASLVADIEGFSLLVGHMITGQFLLPSPKAFLTLPSKLTVCPVSSAVTYSMRV